VRDALRLAFGTLTVLPVRPPSQVDRRTAGAAMAVGPVVGAALGATAALATWLLRGWLDPLLLAALAVTVVAAATRLLHWDGLADTADGLGSGRPADQALEVMRRSDIGPFGVFAILAVFVLQVVALREVLTAPHFLAVTASNQAQLVREVESVQQWTGLGALLAALVLGRCALLAACRRGVPAARPDGLGAAVAGSVGPGQLAVGGLGAALLLGLTVLLDPALAWPALLLAAAVSVLWAVAGTAYLSRRLGGMTGDTMGALVETTTAVALLVLAAAT
jgi:adenosylcobinamide-GDP ribazoletransferase